MWVRRLFSNFPLHLPTTSLPMRADSSQREPSLGTLSIYLYCVYIYVAQGLVQWQLGLPGPPFVLLDGPPFANGALHVGHLLNKVIKDMVARHRVLLGQSVMFRPGWDCHGLPIEAKALETLKQEQREALSALEVRERARTLAEEAMRGQKADFQRWGIMADWDMAYKTMDVEYEANQLEVFGEMVRKGLIFRALKPVHWSPSSKTALAEAELEYVDNHKSIAVLVSFKLNELECASISLPEGTSLVIWTTTPWTLPSNMALAVNPEISYAIVSCALGFFIVAAPLVENFAARIKHVCVVVCSLSGSSLVGLTCRHPFISRNAVIIGGNHVSGESGTGIVHTAPGHGMEDFLAMREAGFVDIIMCVDEVGRFTSDAGLELAGKSVLGDGNIAVVDILKRVNALLQEETIQHRYPYDWRTKKPIIQRAAKQWFCRLNELQESAIKSLEVVQMIPLEGRMQFIQMLKGRLEWCISRQRHWGLPIPVFYDSETGDPLLSLETIEHVKNLFLKYGSSCWWSLPVEELLPEAYLKNGKKYIKGSDTMDVWFDSGTAWKTTKDKLPVDLIVEGEDQFRGWFQSLLLTSVAVNGIAPYRTIITHGFVLDEQNRKMSKSIGNVVTPSEIIDGGKNRVKQPAYGVDVLRLWVASTDYRSAVNIGNSIIEKSFESRNKIRNVCRFLLGNLGDFNESLILAHSKLLPVDKYMLHLLTIVQEQAAKDYSEYQFIKVFRSLMVFVNVDVSAFYSSLAKDRLYHSNTGSLERTSAQFVLFEVYFLFYFSIMQILQTLMRLWAPILCHTMEEVYQHLTPALKLMFKKNSNAVLPENFDSVFCHGFVSSVWLDLVVM